MRILWSLGCLVMAIWFTLGGIGILSQSMPEPQKIERNFSAGTEVYTNNNVNPGMFGTFTIHISLEELIKQANSGNGKLIVSFEDDGIRQRLRYFLSRNGAFYESVEYLGRQWPAGISAKYTEFRNGIFWSYPKPNYARAVFYFFGSVLCLALAIINLFFEAPINGPDRKSFSPRIVPKRIFSSVCAAACIVVGVYISWIGLSTLRHPTPKPMILTSELFSKAEVRNPEQVKPGTFKVELPIEEFKGKVDKAPPLAIYKLNATKPTDIFPLASVLVQYWQSGMDGVFYYSQEEFTPNWPLGFEISEGEFIPKEKGLLVKPRRDLTFIGLPMLGIISFAFGIMLLNRGWLTE